MNPEELDAIEELIRALTATYTVKPEELRIERKEHLGAVYWNLTAHGDDMPALVGGGNGSHVKALAKILREIGEHHDQLFTLNLKEPHTPRSREVFGRVAKPTGYDYSASGQLLKRILDAIGITDHAIESSFLPHPKYDEQSIKFRIYTRSEDDYGRLVGKTFDAEDEATSEVSLIGAIGTLFRAYAWKERVKFTLEVARS